MAAVLVVLRSVEIARPPAPVLAPPTGATGRPVDGIEGSAAERLAFRVHAHLQIFVDGELRGVPAGIGVVPPLQVRQTPQGLFVVGGAAFC